MRQDGQFASPWSLATRLKGALWQLAWLTLFRPTPKPMIRWRVLLLRLFGAEITGRPFIASSAIVKMPWNLVLEDRACIGPGANVYNLGRVVLKSRSVVAQEVYLCGGAHDFSDPRLPLVTGEIVVGADAFLGVRALILPGVVVGEGAVVGAGSVVTSDVPPWTICAGNPCRPIKPRVFGAQSTGSLATNAPHDSSTCLPPS
jgi:putative colanic acid biosynthesis acetyltransferase WcaF